MSEIIKALISGNDYFDVAKCTVILEHLVLKIQYNFLEKSDNLLQEIENGHYNLIVLSLDFNEDLLKHFKDAYLKNNKPILCIFYGKKPKENYQFFYNDLDKRIATYPFLIAPFTPIKFADSLENILQKINQKTPKEKLELAPYVAIKMQFLRKFKITPFDIYVLSDSEKYIRLKTNGSLIESDLLNKYKEKGIKEFYITKIDFIKYQEQIYTLPFYNNDDHSMTTEEKLHDVNNILLDIINDIGLTENVVNFVNNYTEKIIQLTEHEKPLALMFESAIKSHFTYNYDHSYMTSLICIKIAQNLDWMTPKMQEKVCMSALVHDLTYSNAKSSYSIDVKKENINLFLEKERKEYLKHTMDISSYLGQISTIPQEVINIVSQHHETVDGTGFPKKLSAHNMSPIVGIFLMAHDFINEIYSINFNASEYQYIIHELVAKYSIGNFKEVAKAFEHSMLENFS